MSYITKEEFIKMAREVHGDKYGYEKLPDMIWYDPDEENKIEEKLYRGDAIIPILHSMECRIANLEEGLSILRSGDIDNELYQNETVVPTMKDIEQRIIKLESKLIKKLKKTEKTERIKSKNKKSKK